MFVAMSLMLMSWWIHPAAPPEPVDPAAAADVAMLDDQPPPEVDKPSRNAQPPPPPDDETGRHHRQFDGRGRWRESFRDSRRPLPPELIEQAMEVLQEKLPEFAQRMKKLSDENPQRFERAMRMILPMVMEYIELRDRDEKMAETIIQEFKIEHQLRDLSRQYRAADDDPARQASCEEKIRDLVRQQIDIRLLRQDARLKEFSERLERQRQQLEKEKQELAQQRTKVDELIAGRIQEVKAGKFGERFSPGFGRHGRPGPFDKPASGPEGPVPGGPGPRLEGDRHGGQHGERPGVCPAPASQNSPPPHHHDDDADEEL